jgi:hypothetical protein
MKRTLLILSLAALACLPARSQGVDRLGDRELSLSLGDGLGDFHSTFAWGFCLSLPVQEKVRAELEIFYYFNPTEFSRTAGLAVTSTGLSIGINWLGHWPLAGSRLILEAGAAFGQMTVSETWKYSSPKHKISRHSREILLGPAAGLQVRLDRWSGVRFDFRYLIVPWDGRRIPRLSIGYALWY